jgi:phage-related protein
MALKPVSFHGDSLDRLRDFPQDARREAGYELHQVQKGANPTDWKPMPTVGAAVREIRIRAASGTYRVIYVAACRRHSCAARLPQEKPKDGVA